jgi:hypothetical protein
LESLDWDSLLRPSKKELKPDSISSLPVACKLQILDFLVPSLKELSLSQTHDKTKLLPQVLLSKKLDSSKLSNFDETELKLLENQGFFIKDHFMKSFSEDFSLALYEEVN